MKKWLKATLISVCCLIPIGFVIGFSTNWSHKTTITSVGSSGVKPFIEELSKEYIKDNPGIDITVDAGGSGFGIEQVAKGYTDIGNASKDPYSSVNDEAAGLLDSWKDKRIKTYTVAWEGICLVYIPPKGLSQDAIDRLFPSEDNAYPLLHVDEDNIKNLYQAFSGFNDGEYKNTTPKLGDFIYSASQDHPDVPDLDDFDINLLNTNITPYVRTGGSLTSGTAASFYQYSRIKDFNPSDLSPNTQKAFEVGNYGNAWKIIQTDEANSRAWDMFSKSNKPGSIVYLSSGFIAKNISLIKNKGYGVFGYNGKPYTTYNMCNHEYNWCRPLDLMTSLYSTEGEKDFIENFLLSSELDKRWEDLGAAPLTESQKESMKKDGSYDVSDVEMVGRSTYGADF